MLAIIAGSGFYDFPEIQAEAIFNDTTPFGHPSSGIKKGVWRGRPVVFLARHGVDHHYMPHQINYRANIYALSILGVTDIISVNVVGGISSKMRPETRVLPGQFIDYTWGRQHTFYGDLSIQNPYVDCSKPFDLRLQGVLVAALDCTETRYISDATYGCTQGPRLESAAEILRMERDGCDVVGMTLLPELILARELGIRFASLSVVVNWAAGKSEETISVDRIKTLLSKTTNNTRQILLDSIERL